MAPTQATSATSPFSHRDKDAYPVRSHEISLPELAVGVVIGRIADFFDFFVFGIAAVLVFPFAFFPFAGRIDGVFDSLAIFSIAFVARPMGSIFFAFIHRRFGRRVKLTGALIILATATIGIGFLPEYATIGWFSIFGLAFFRFGQGFAIGGSWDGLPSLLTLRSPPNRKGSYAMVAQLGAPIGFILAAGLFAYLDMALSHGEFIRWGWRYPFFVAFSISGISLFARLLLIGSKELETLFEAEELRPSLIGEVLQTEGRNIFLGTFAPLGSYALFNVASIFALSWALLFTTQSIGAFLIAQIAGAVAATLCMVMSGEIANRIGRRKTLAICAICIAIFCGFVPLFLHGGIKAGYAFVIIGFALLGFSHAQAAGVVNSAFRRNHRYTGAMITSDLGWFFGAGFAPLVALAIAYHLGVNYVALYLLSGAIGTAGALFLSRFAGLRYE